MTEQPLAARSMSSDRAPLTRREALRLLSAAAGAGVLAGLSALPRRLAAAEPLTTVTATPQQAPIIRTLAGDLAPSGVPAGTILFHEHLSIQLGPNPSFHSDVELMIDEVRGARADGVSLIVDGGHPDMRRDLRALQRIAREGGMPIVASGGYYMQRTYPPEIGSQSVEQVADGLVTEALRDRLGAFGEIGQQDGVLTADERKVHQAVALAHVRTGIPVFTHNAYSIRRPEVPRDTALRQLDIYEEAGADLNNICIGHVCCLDDPRAEVAIELARRGAYVGFDRVTLNGTMPDENRVVMAMAMIEAGQASKLLLSSDFYSRPALKANGGPGLAQTETVFGAMLLDAGLDRETLRGILDDNPRRFLTFAPRA